MMIEDVLEGKYLITNNMHSLVYFHHHAEIHRISKNHVIVNIWNNSKAGAHKSEINTGI